MPTRLQPAWKKNDWAVTVTDPVKFQKIFKELTLAARRGDSDAIMRVSVYGTHHINTAQVALSVMFEHLQLDKIPDSYKITSSPTIHMRHALLAIRGLRVFVFKHEETERLLMQRTKWVALWGWSRFLIINCLEKTMATASGKAFKEEVSDELDALFYLLVKGLERTVACMEATPDLIPTFARLWHSEYSYAPGRRRMSILLAGMLSNSARMQTFQSAATKQFVQTLGSDRHAIASVCLRRFGRASSATQMDLLDIRASLSIVNDVAIYNPEIGDTIIAQGLLTAATSVLHRVIHSDDGSNPNQFEKCVLSLLKHAHSLSARAPRYASEALKAGLLDCVLSIPRIMENQTSEDYQTVYDGILALLTMFVHHYCVIRRLAKSVKVWEERESEEIPKGPYWPSWDRLRRAVHNRVEAGRGFRKGPPMKCSYNECPLLAYPDGAWEVKEARPKRCGGCLSAVYCSETCQIKAWTRHRTSCKPIWDAHRTEQLPNPEPLPSQDLFYLTCCVTRDVTSAQNMPVILRQRQIYLDQHPGVDERLLTTKVDYRAVPFQITVVHADDVRETMVGIGGSANFDAPVQRALELGRPLVFARIPRSEDANMFWFNVY